MGYVAIHEKILYSEYYQDWKCLKVWLFLLLKARRLPAEKDWHGKKITLQPGQLITSYKSISAATGLNKSATFRVLKRFENDGKVKRKAGTKSTLITITNWSKYQKSETQTKRKRNDNGTIMESKDTVIVLEGEESVNTDNKKHTSASSESSERFETFWSNYPRKIKGAKTKIKGFFTKLKAEDQEQVLKALEEYKRYWEEQGTEEQFRPMPQKFINQDYWKPEQVPQSRRTKYEQDKEDRNKPWFNPFTEQWQ